MPASPSPQAAASSVTSRTGASSACPSNGRVSALRRESIESSSHSYRSSSTPDLVLLRLREDFEKDENRNKQFALVSPYFPPDTLHFRETSDHILNPAAHALRRSGSQARMAELRKRAEEAKEKKQQRARGGNSGGESDEDEDEDYGDGDGAVPTEYHMTNYDAELDDQSMRYEFFRVVPFPPRDAEPNSKVGSTVYPLLLVTNTQGVPRMSAVCKRTYWEYQQLSKLMGAGMSTYKVTMPKLESISQRAKNSAERRMEAIRAFIQALFLNTYSFQSLALQLFLYTSFQVAKIKALIIRSYNNGETAAPFHLISKRMQAYEKDILSRPLTVREAFSYSDLGCREDCELGLDACNEEELFDYVDDADDADAADGQAEEEDSEDDVDVGGLKRAANSCAAFEEYRVINQGPVARSMPRMMTAHLCSEEEVHHRQVLHSYLQCGQEERVRTTASPARAGVDGAAAHDIIEVYNPSPRTAGSCPDAENCPVFIKKRQQQLLQQQQRKDRERKEKGGIKKSASAGKELSAQGTRRRLAASPSQPILSASLPSGAQAMAAEMDAGSEGSGGAAAGKISWYVDSPFSNRGEKLDAIDEENGWVAEDEESEDKDNSSMEELMFGEEKE